MPSQSPAPPLMMQRHHGLQGPRPATLKVTKQADLGLKKRPRPAQAQQQARQPVIIYVESPKVVHAHPSEFKSFVQRLTGAPPVPSSSSMMMFPTPASGLPPPLQLQFPFQLYGQQLPLVATASSLSPTTTVAAPPGSSLPADAASVVRSLGFFSNDHLISPAAAFLYDQSMVAFPAGAAAVQAANPLLVPSSLGGESTPSGAAAVHAANPLLVPSSLGDACYHGDLLFVNQQ